MKQPKHWQDPVNAVVGIWLIASPWVLGIQAGQAAMLNAIVIGLALIAAALGAILVPRAWEEWTEFALGVWLVISPWVLGYSMLGSATMSALVSGLVVAALALWTLGIDKDYGGWWSKGAAQH